MRLCAPWAIFRANFLRNRTEPLRSHAVPAIRAIRFPLSPGAGRLADRRPSNGRFAGPREPAEVAGARAGGTSGSRGDRPRAGVPEIPQPSLRRPVPFPPVLQPVLHPGGREVRSYLGKL